MLTLSLQLRIIHGGIYDHDDLFESDKTVTAARSEFIELRDIRCIEKEIEAESVRLHPDDGESTLKWVEILRAKGHLLGFKSRTDPSPCGSDLPPDVFLLMIQTEWQRRMFAKYGEPLLCIDATHNVSMYENLNLTTLVVRDRWKHGMSLLAPSCTTLYSLAGIPVAWMLATSGSQATITYFLKVHRARSPATIPCKIMSDFCWPQINACRDTYLAFILLCWWHVLHAWQQHFKILANEELWELLKRWIRMTEATEFNVTWQKIQDIAPEDFVDYLKSYWMSEEVIKMWSAVHRTPRSMLEDCDTNMLIEA